MPKAQTPNFRKRTIKNPYEWPADEDTPRSAAQEIPGKECGACKGTGLGRQIGLTRLDWCESCGGGGKEK